MVDAVVVREPLKATVMQGAPVPSAADLAAYDGAQRRPVPRARRRDDGVARAGMLSKAQTMSFHQVAKKDSKKALYVLRVDVDGVVGALSILLHLGLDRAQPAKRDANTPYFAFAADVVLGDGQDGRVVQTVSCAGVGDQGLGGATRGKGLPVEVIDRGSATPIYVERPSDTWQLCAPLLTCRVPEDALTVQRGAAGVRLVATSALNGAGCRRAWVDYLISIPTFCSGPVCLLCCVAPPTRHYEVQDAQQSPLGGARYAVPGHTFCKTCYLPGGMDGNRIDFGAAPLEARRDIVAAAVAQFGFLTAYPELG